MRSTTTPCTLVTCAHCVPRSGLRRCKARRHWLGSFVLAAGVALAPRSEAQIVQEKLLAPDGDAGHQFGMDVALVPGWAFCAAPLEDEVFAASGAVYVYGRVGTGWSFAHKLVPDGPAFGGALGSALAADGPWMVATTPVDDPQGYVGRGSAHVYRLQNGSWIHTQKLLASDFTSPAQAYFGQSVDLRGERLVVGEDDDGTQAHAAGSAYVFELAGSSWVELAKLYASDWEIGASFGSGVSVDGDILIVGAPQEDNGVLGSNRGAAYVFERSGAGWVQTQKLVGSDVGNDEYFGQSVAIDGDVALVGSSHSHAASNDGAIYVFERQGGTWVQTQELVASDPQGGPQLGVFVALDGDLAVGSAQADTDLGINSGSSYVFRRTSSGGWLQIAKVLAPDAAPYALFGSAVDVCGRELLIGSWGDRDNGLNSGSAYVLEIAPDAIQYGSCASQGPCRNHDDFGGCRTSSGQGAVLSAAGSAGIALDDLRFEARWLPANKLGLFFMGGVATFQPFADGRLCTASGGAGIWRFPPPQSSGAGGVLDLGPGVVGLSSSLPAGAQIAAGETWHFQAWFRDPSGPCGMGSNLTNALRVTFAP
jgi:hypothetical protein